MSETFHGIRTSRHYLTLPKFINSFVLQFVLLLSSHAQQNPFRVYTTADGLISNRCGQIFQDEDGFMWYSSLEGLSIYDGHQFKNLTYENGGLSENEVSGIFLKNKNETWVLHPHGIDVFQKRRFVKNLPVSGISSICLTRDRRVIGAGKNGIYDLESEKKIPLFSFSKDMDQIIEIGNFFLSTGDYLDSVFLFDSSFKKIGGFHCRGRPYKDRKGQYWWIDKELHLLDTMAIRNAQFGLMPIPSLLKQTIQGRVGDFFLDAEGNYWVDLPDKGFLRVGSDGQVKIFDQAQGLNSNLYSRFFEDTEKNIWISTNGVIKFLSERVEIYAESDGLASSSISNMAEQKNMHSIWMAQIKGISLFYQNKIYNFPYVGRQTCSYSHIYLRGDSLWVGFPGIVLYRVHYAPQPHLEFLKQWTHCGKFNIGYAGDFCCYKDGGMLATTGEGRLFYIGRLGNIKQVENSLWLLKMLYSDNELWTGALEKGIRRWKFRESKDGLRLDLIQQYDSLTANHIRSMTKDRNGNYWFGTRYDGLIEFERQKNDSFLIRRYGIRQGLSSNWIRKILVDEKGRIFVGTSKGLCMLNITSDSIIVDDISRKLGLTNEIYDLLVTEEGEIWMSTPTGAIKITNHFKDIIPSPRTYITKMAVNDDTADIEVIQKKGAAFSYKKNNIGFEFTATSYRNEEQTLFSYKLENNRSPVPWSSPDRVHNVVYTSLAPGNYTFSVKALPFDNNRSEIPACVHFTILAPFWETWWFRVSILIFVLCLTGGIFWYRLRQIKKFYSLRAEISRDLHDEIGSTLSGVRLVSQMAAHQLQEHDEKEAGHSLEKIVLNTGEMLGKMRDIVWAINPQNDQFDMILVRLKTFAASATATRGIVLHFNAADLQQTKNPGMHLRKNVYLICKEAINNAIKHANCRNLYFDSFQQDQKIVISIRDDGNGFEADSWQDGNGIRNMYARAKEMKAKLEVVSEKEKGSTIMLSFKIT